MSLYEKLPLSLQYLIGPAENYGRYQFGEQVVEFLDAATAEDMAKLAEVAEQYRNNGHAPILDEFLDQYPITDYEESSRLYFLLGVIDAAGFELSNADWNTVESHLDTLQRFGNYRLASERMHATKFLADFGRDAATAIPLLQKGCGDEDRRVQVWANFALFKIASDDEKYIDSIRRYLNDSDSEIRTEAASALHALGNRASSAIPELVELIGKTGEDEYDVGVYMESLVAIGDRTSIVIETLKSAVNSDTELIRDVAKEFLTELGVAT